jgi:hypothetical protein
MLDADAHQDIAELSLLRLVRWKLCIERMFAGLKKRLLMAHFRIRSRREMKEKGSTEGFCCKVDALPRWQPEILVRGACE